MGPLCLISVLQNIFLLKKKALLQYDRLPLAHEIQNEKDAHVFRDLQNDYHILTERIAFLTRLMDGYGVNVSNKTHLQPPSDLMASIKDFLRYQEDDLFCSDYYFGEERHLAFFTVGKHNHYKVKRERDGSYTAIMALEFSASEGYDGPVPRHLVHEYYLQTVRASLNHAQPKLLGPDGERLRVVIEDARTADVCMPKYTVHIGRAGGGSSVLNYASDIDTPATVHEIFHQTGGLPDEYALLYPGMSCRVTQQSSLMADEAIRWNNVFNTAIYGSLLDPSHFNAILYGNCSEREDVQLFRQCSELSYQNVWNGNNACLEIKKDCESKNVLGRSKDREIHRLRMALRHLNVDGLEEVRTTGNTRRSRVYRELVEDLQKRLRATMDWPD